MRTEKEYYTECRKVCCYCDRERAREYKRKNSPTWSCPRVFSKPERKRTEIARRAEPGAQVQVERPKKPIPESLRAHVEALKRLREAPI